MLISVTQEVLVEVDGQSGLDVVDDADSQQVDSLFVSTSGSFSYSPQAVAGSSSSSTLSNNINSSSGNSSSDYLCGGNSSLTLASYDVGLSGEGLTVEGGSFLLS